MTLYILSPPFNCINLDNKKEDKINYLNIQIKIVRLVSV